MSKITALVSFGIGIIAIGFFYQLFDDVIIRYLTPYIRPSIYHTGEAFLWDLVPWVCFFLGIISLVIAGVVSRTSTRRATE